jgi:putative transposase
MPRKKHTPEEVVRKLRQADAWLNEGQMIGQVCQKLEVSEQTFHRWRATYGGMKMDQMKRLKELEEENRKLKHVVADQALDIVGMREILRGKW